METFWKLIKSLLITLMHICQDLDSVLTSVADPGCLSRIPDPTFFHPGSRIRTVSIPDPETRIPDPHQRI